MNKLWLSMAAGLGLASAAARADVWDDFARFEYGAPHAGAVEKLIQDTPAERHGEIEAKLIAVVSSPGSTRAAKTFACRFLQQVGTARCVPAVGALLADPALADAVRLVLERLDGGEAGALLRAALPRVPDAVKPGVIGSLGRRRDAQAVPIIGPLAQSPDPAIAAAALRALGEIGGMDAARGLARMTVPPALQPARLLAIVECARSLPPKEAVALCKIALDSPYIPARVGAVGVAMEKDPTRAAPVVAAVIKGDDPRMRQGVLSLAAEGFGGPVLTEALAALLDGLPPERTVEMITVLGHRGDSRATAALARRVGSGDAAVRTAVLKALGRVGDASAVGLLLGAIDTPQSRAASEQAIAAMTADGIDEALLDALREERFVPPAIAILIARRYAAATPALLARTNDPDAEVRRQAWQGIGGLAAADHVEPAVRQMMTVNDAEERGLAARALRSVVARVDEKAACLDIAARLYDAATPAVKSVFLNLGPLSGDAAALAMQRKALQSGDAELHGQALRALAAWPNASAAEDLVRLAKTDEDETNRILALRGYIRLAGPEIPDLNPAERMRIYTTAAAMTDRNEENLQIISGLRTVESGEALDLLAAFMKKPDLAAAAEMSAMQAAQALRRVDTGRVEIMARLLQESTNAQVAGQARALLGELDAVRAFIAGWMASEIYEGGFDDLFARALPPEQAGAEVKWTLLANGISPDRIDLHQALGRRDGCAVYLRTTLVSPRAQRVRFEMGSDDAIKAWINGALIHEKKANRAVQPGEDKVEADLKAGENRVLLKIVQGSGEWGASLFVRSLDGRAVDGLGVRAQ